MRIAHVLASFLCEAAIQTLDMQRWSNGERLDTSENSVKTAEGRESNCRTVVWSLKTFADIVLNIWNKETVSNLKAYGSGAEPQSVAVEWHDRHPTNDMSLIYRKLHSKKGKAGKFCRRGIMAQIPNLKKEYFGELNFSGPFMEQCTLDARWVLRRSGLDEKWKSTILTMKTAVQRCHSCHFASSPFDLLAAAAFHLCHLTFIFSNPAFLSFTFIAKTLNKAQTNKSPLLGDCVAWMSWVCLEPGDYFHSFFENSAGGG